MKEDSSQSTSAWMASAAKIERPALDADAQCDVCVVGAGIAGLTTAYLLAREGKSVVLLDDGAIGGGETGRTTAHLVTALDDRYYDLERLHGARGARLAAESHRAAIDRVEAIVAEERIDCAFTRVDGYLFVPPGEPVEELDRELAAAHRAGLTDLVRVDRAPVDSFDTGPALRFPRQAQFHPLAYLAGLVRAFEARGGRVFLGTHAKTIEGGTPARIVTDRGKTVSAGAVVVATNTPVNDVVAIHTKQVAYRTYVVGLRVPGGALPRILLWDTPEPYHYVRLLGAPDGEPDLLIVGGEDHRTGQEDDADERFARLEKWTRERFPMAGEVLHRWSGQVMEPVDSLAFIGRNPADDDNVYVITGDSGNGMTHCTLGAMLVTDLACGRANEWETLYDPSRKTLGAAYDYAVDNLNTAAQYSDWLTAGEVESVDEIEAGSGAVVRRGLHKIAAYRDASGELVELSATCTHLGGVVRWNSMESSWDCPCHGSRFDARGKVLNGPAISDLGPAD